MRRPTAGPTRARPRGPTRRRPAPGRRTSLPRPGDVRDPAAPPARQVAHRHPRAQPLVHGDHVNVLRGREAVGDHDHGHAPGRAHRGAGDARARRHRDQAVHTPVDEEAERLVDLRLVADLERCHQRAVIGPARGRLDGRRRRGRAAVATPAAGPQSSSRMAQLKTWDCPTARVTRSVPELKASGGQVMGSTATPRRPRCSPL